MCGLPPSRFPTLEYMSKEWRTPSSGNLDSDGYWVRDFSINFRKQDEYVGTKYEELDENNAGII